MVPIVKWDKTIMTRKFEILTNVGSVHWVMTLRIFNFENVGPFLPSRQDYKFFEILTNDWLHISKEIHLYLVEVKVLLEKCLKHLSKSIWRQTIVPYSTCIEVWNLIYSERDCIGSSKTNESWFNDESFDNQKQLSKKKTTLNNWWAIDELSNWTIIY